MHELSIAMGVVDTACEEAVRRGAARVTVVYLRLGPLSGVVEDALRLSFAIATQGTLADGARLEIEEAPLVARCATCDTPRTVASVQRLACPVCGAPTPDVLSGRECQIVALEIDDDVAANR